MENREDVFYWEELLGTHSYFQFCNFLTGSSIGSLFFLFIIVLIFLTHLNLYPIGMLKMKKCQNIMMLLLSLTRFGISKSASFSNDRAERHDFGYSFPLFSSLLKKDGKKKRIVIKKSCLSA